MIGSEESYWVPYRESDMPRKRPRIARLDQVRTSRDGEDAIIEFQDTGSAASHLRIGPQVHQLTDAEILLVYNQTIAAQNPTSR